MMKPPELLCARYVRSYVRALLAPGGAQEPKRPPGGRGGRGDQNARGPRKQPQKADYVQDMCGVMCVRRGRDSQKPPSF